MSSVADLPDFDQVFRGIPGRHALLLPAEVSPARYSLTVSSQFPGARMHDDGSVSLIGTTVLRPPRMAEPEEFETRQIPLSCPIVIDVEAPTSRGDAPAYPRALGVDPVADIFPDGPPEGAEAQVVHWLVSAARFLGGAVLLDEVLYTPDPEAVGPLAVYSTVWLDPESGLAAVSSVTPARFPAVPVAPGFQSDDEPPLVDGYAIEVPLGDDGRIIVEVAEETALPDVVTAHAPPDVDLTRGAIGYTATWLLADSAAAQLEHLAQSDDELQDVTLGAELYDAEVLGQDLAMARRRANLVLIDVVTQLRAAVGGVVVTRSGFPVLDTGR